MACIALRSENTKMKEAPAKEPEMREKGIKKFTVPAFEILLSHTMGCGFAIMQRAMIALGSLLSLSAHLILLHWSKKESQFGVEFIVHIRCCYLFTFPLSQKH